MLDQKENKKILVRERIVKSNHKRQKTRTVLQLAACAVAGRTAALVGAVRRKQNKKGHMVDA